MHIFHHRRHFAASPEVIFAAIQAPERLARWWGPEGFTNRFTTFAFQAGGPWVSANEQNLDRLSKELA